MPAPTKINDLNVPEIIYQMNLRTIMDKVRYLREQHMDDEPLEEQEAVLANNIASIENALMILTNYLNVVKRVITKKHPPPIRK